MLTVLFYNDPVGKVAVAEKKSGAIGLSVRLANVSKRSFGFRPVGHVQLPHSHVSTGRDSSVVRPREPSSGLPVPKNTGPTTPDWSCYREAFRELQLLRILIKALGGWLHQCDFE
jgi:hypothetical protein